MRQTFVQIKIHFKEHSHGVTSFFRSNFSNFYTNNILFQKQFFQLKFLNFFSIKFVRKVELDKTSLPAPQQDFIGTIRQLALADRAVFDKVGWMVGGLFVWMNY